MAVNDFERDINTTVANSTATPFTVASNIHYRVNDLNDLTKNNYMLLNQIIAHFNTYQVPRLSVLDAYSKAKNTGIYSRPLRKDDTKADYRIAHNFGKLVAQFVAGYTTSVPLKYTIADEQLQSIIEDFNSYNDIYTLDSELMFDVAKYGRAYDIQYKADNVNCIKLANVFETFVIYDTSIERKPIAAVRITQNGFTDKASQPLYLITLYTDSEIISFQPTEINQGAVLKAADISKHFYNALPITEYSSNRYRASWYEDIISLIDAYDQSASDTSNYMTDLINSLLVIQGDFNTNKDVKDIIKQIKQYGIMGLQNGIDRNGNATRVDAKYISPIFDSVATEAYKNRIKQDIFNISNVPDMSDKNFSGNSSGVAMRYKIFGFEQAIAQTTNAFKKSLARRYDVLFKLMHNLNAIKEVDDTVKVVFTPNLPYAVSEEVNMLNGAGVPVSHKTLYNQVHFTDAATEFHNLEEQEKQMQSNPYNFLGAAPHE